MQQLVAWFARLVRPKALRPDSGDVAAEIQYLTADHAPWPTPDGAAYRLETRQLAGLTEQRRYHLQQGPEWLVETLETGHDATGQPLRRLTQRLPWGQITKQVERSGDSLSYRRYFPNGDLQLLKQAVAGRLIERFVYVPSARYEYVEQMPKYQDGDFAHVVRAIQKACKYPAKALRNGEQGRVVAGFVVTDTGLVENIEILESVTPSLDEAVRQAVASVGGQRWVPGFQNRRAVAVSFKVPITLKIQ